MPAKTELMYGNTQRFQRQTSQVGWSRYNDCGDDKMMRGVYNDDEYKLVLVVKKTSQELK